MGCWPNANPTDPEIYCAALELIFQKYPSAAVARICDPLKGIPARLTFLPTLAEITQALEEEMRPLIDERREKDRLKLLEKTIHFYPTNKEKERVAELTKNLFNSFGKEFAFAEGESKNLPDHIASDGTMSYASAMKFKLKQAGYPRARIKK